MAIFTGYDLTMERQQRCRVCMKTQQYCPPSLYRFHLATDLSQWCEMCCIVIGNANGLCIIWSTGRAIGCLREASPQLWCTKWLWSVSSNCPRVTLRTKANILKTKRFVPPNGVFFTVFFSPHRVSSKSHIKKMTPDPVASSLGPASTWINPWKVCRCRRELDHLLSIKLLVYDNIFWPRLSSRSRPQINGVSPLYFLAFIFLGTCCNKRIWNVFTWSLEEKTEKPQTD